MSMRTRDAFLLGLLALAGCSDYSVTDFGGELIRCRFAGSQRFEPVCAVERKREPRGVVLTVRHPDGGFRRLAVRPDGSGLETADGAEKAVVTLAGATQIEVTIEGDSYRIPARIAAQ